MADATHLYAIGIGSNRPHGLYGRPQGVVETAIARLDRHFGSFDASPIVLDPAHGPAGRDFANAAALVESDLDPVEMLDRLKQLERDFGAKVGPPLGSPGARSRSLAVEWWQGVLAPSHGSASAACRPRFRARATRGDRPKLAYRTAQGSAPGTPACPSPPQRVTAACTLHVGPIAQSVEQLTFNQ